MIVGFSWAGPTYEYDSSTVVDTYFHGYDIHVVRNGFSSPSLLESLVIYHSDNPQIPILLSDTVKLATISDSVEVKFVPRVVSTLTVDEYSFNNVILSEATGVITAGFAPFSSDPYHSDFNFVIDALLYVNGNPFDADFRLAFRVHVHDEVVSAWLTPNKLTIRPFTSFRFSVYAEFSDGTIGDLTQHPGLLWATNDLLATVNSRGYISVHSDLIAATDIEVTATVESDAMFQSASGTLTLPPNELIIEYPWFVDESDPSPYVNNVEPVGYYNAPVDENDRVFNFLIIPDGFQDNEDDRFSFNYMTDEIPGLISSYSSFAPWNYFIETKLNFWRLFVPSADAGVSILNEMVPKKIDGFSGYVPGAMTSIEEMISDIDSYLAQNLDCPDPDYTVNVGSPENPWRRNNPISGANYNLTQLIDIVGLPTQLDVDSGITVSDIFGKWTTLFKTDLVTYLDPVDPADVEVTEDLVHFWLMLADRRLINENNTVLGLTFGEKPIYTGTGTPARGIEQHRLNSRATRTDLNELLKHLGSTDEPDFEAEKEWSYRTEGESPSEVFIQGSSINYVIMLGGGTRYGGERADIKIYDTVAQEFKIISGSFFSTTRTNHCITSPVSGSRALNVVRHPMGSISGMIHVMFHEMTHIFDILDEYGRDFDEPDNDQVLYPANYNVETRREICTDNSNEIMTGENIKWRWPRVEKCGVLTGEPEPVPDSDPAEFIITCSFAANPQSNVYPADQQVPPFAVGDYVYLRRKLYIDYDPELTTYDITQLGGETAIDAYSNRCIVLTTPDESGSFHVAVSPIVENVLTPGVIPESFPSGSIVVKFADGAFAGLGRVTTSGTAVTGVDTYFKMMLDVGYKILVGTDEAEVQSITDDSHLVLNGSLGTHLLAKYKVIPPATRPYGEYVHDVIRRAITVTNAPLTIEPPTDEITAAVWQDPAPEQLKYDSDPDATVFDKAIKGPYDLALLTGLYINGARYTKGVYHSTGACMMRAMTNYNRDNKYAPYSVPYCPVCQYILANIIDPTYLGWLEIKYRKFNMLKFDRKEA